MEFGKLSGYSADGQKIFLDFEGRKARIEVITPQIINVFCGFESEEHRSKAIEGEKAVPVSVDVEKEEDVLWIKTPSVWVKVSDGFYVDFYDKNGKEVCCDYRGKRAALERVSPEFIALMEKEGHAAPDREDPGAPHPIEIIKKMSGSEHFYGLGDKTGFMDKRHYDYVMWNTDNPNPHVDSFKSLYKSIPYFVTLTDEHIFGIFFDNTYKTYFNMGQESEDYYWFAANKGNLDYYYIAGGSMAEIQEGYAYLTGTCPLPQRWTLGYHQSRWGYVTQKDFEEVASSMRSNDIPCDSIHFDIDYMDGYRVFTWDEKKYNGDSDAFLKRLIDDGFKPVAIIDPGVKEDKGYYVYDEGMEKDYFAKTADGKEVYVNAVWPGDAVYPDFGKPEVRAWWAGLQKFLIDKGVRGVWNDMNEPASFKGPLPDDVLFTDEDQPAAHDKVHNVYGHLMGKASFNGWKEHDGRRPFVITRACYAGTQKYAIGWTGDNTSLWAHLQMAIPQICNMGISGMPFIGTDIGGFGADTTPELLTRWVEVGCFSPLFRNHAALGSRVQEPWRFGKECLDIYRKYVKLRYTLIPYYYDLFFEEEKTGVPVMRPLVYENEHDKTAQTCNDEFMIGSQLLVAPVVYQGVSMRMVYLPEGIWYDYWSGEKLAGPSWILRDAPLDTCPVYVKAGSIIPTMEVQSYVGEKENDVLYLKVYPGKGSYDHYLDDGESYGYREGKYHQYHFEVDEAGNVTTAIVQEGYEKPYKEIKIAVCGEKQQK